MAQTLMLLFSKAVFRGCWEGKVCHTRDLAAHSLHAATCSYPLLASAFMQLLVRAGTTRKEAGQPESAGVQTCPHKKNVCRPTRAMRQSCPLFSFSFIPNLFLSFRCPLFFPNADGFDPGAAADAHRGQAEGVFGAPEGRG